MQKLKSNFLLLFIALSLNAETPPLDKLLRATKDADYRNKTHRDLIIATGYPADSITESWGKKKFGNHWGLTLLSRSEARSYTGWKYAMKVFDGEAELKLSRVEYYENGICLKVAPFNSSGNAYKYDSGSWAAASGERPGAIEQKVLSSVAQFANDRMGNPLLASAEGFIELYKKMTLQQREYTKGNYRGLVERNVPPEIIQMLNSEIAKIDKQDLIDIRFKEAPQDIQESLDDNKPLSTDQRRRLADFKRKQRVAGDIVSKKRQAKGLSKETIGYMDNQRYNECKARIVSMLPVGKEFHEGWLTEGKKILATRKYIFDKKIRLPGNDKVARIRNFKTLQTPVGPISSRESYVTMVKKTGAKRGAYFDAFKDAVKFDNRCKDWLIFGDNTFKENPEFWDLELSQVRFPKKENGKIALNGQGSPIYHEVLLIGEKRLEGSGPFSFSPPN